MIYKAGIDHHCPFIILKKNPPPFWSSSEYFHQPSNSWKNVLGHLCVGFGSSRPTCTPAGVMDSPIGPRYSIRWSPKEYAIRQSAKLASPGVMLIDTLKRSAAVFSHRTIRLCPNAELVWYTNIKTIISVLYIYIFMCNDKGTNASGWNILVIMFMLLTCFEVIDFGPLKVFRCWPFFLNTHQTSHDNPYQGQPIYCIHVTYMYAKKSSEVAFQVDKHIVWQMILTMHLWQLAVVGSICFKLWQPTGQKVNGAYP